MRKEDKNTIIEGLKEQINASSHFYLTDINGLNAEDTSDLRRKCFDKEISLVVVKNTLLKLALERADGNFEELYPVLTGNTSIMFTEVGSCPAKLIKEIRSSKEKPVIKGAYVEESIYIGDRVEELASIKTKDEVIGDIIMLLQSPMKNVIASLKSGQDILSGVVKTLSDKKE